MRKPSKRGESPIQMEINCVGPSALHLVRGFDTELNQTEDCVPACY